MLKYGKVLVLAVLAGMAIGVGGVVYLSVDNQIFGACLFAVGLYTICIHGLHLFTGKAGYLVNQPASYLVYLVWVWIGNLIGTWIVAMLICGTRRQVLAEKAQALCMVKLEDSLLSLFILGIFCGLLMYIAVDSYKQVQNPVILVAAVAAFILCGFEHCVADMFYFSMAGAWSLYAMICTVVISFGNVAGAILIPMAKKMPDIPM